LKEEKEKEHSLEDSNVHILDREDRWFKRGVKEAIYAKLEKPTLNRFFRYHLPSTYNAALSVLPRQFHNHSHLGSGDQNVLFQTGKQLTAQNDFKRPTHWSGDHYCL